MGKTDIKKVAGAIVAGVLLAGAGAFTTGYVKDVTINDQAGQISQLQNDIKTLEDKEPIVKEVITEVEKIVNKTVIVEVDNENLGLVLDHIYDNDGNIEYLTDDLNEDEVDQIVNRIVFINEIKVLAAQEVDKELADLLDREEFTFNNETVEFDEDDIERVRVQDDDDEIKVIDVDFEDGDADVEVEVKFEQDDVKYKALLTVEFRDGEVDDIDVESVELR